MYINIYYMKSCCLANKKAVKCIRNSDGKVFSLPRKFTKHICLQGVRGYTMKSSCAPYKDCKKTFDVYTDQNPNDTISIKYTTLQNVKDTISKLERLYKRKQYSHKRIWQVSMILMVRLRVLKKQKPKHYQLAKNYFDFVGRRTKLPKEKRQQIIFNKNFRV